ncbi:MAG: hypothetical protein U9Q15_04150 [Patescibacteria group bacterium]|nr:hypothetical protein [Patescibacteria group bacterium]
MEEKDGKLRLTDVAIGSDKKSEYEKFLEEFSKSDENPLKKEIEEKIEKEIEKEIEKLRETSEELAEAFIEEEIKSLQNDLGDSLNSKFNTSVKNSTRDLYEFEMRQRSGYAGQTKKFNGFNNMLANRRDGKYIDVVESLGQATVGTAVDSAKKVGAGVSTVVGGPTQAASKVATDIF